MTVQACDKSIKITMEASLKRYNPESHGTGHSVPSKSPRLSTQGENGGQDEANPKPFIRVRENLTNKPSLPLTGESIDSSSRDCDDQLSSEIKLLREEIRALHWLARRKEQEWDNVIRLLKQKEERLLRSERKLSLSKPGAGLLLRSAQNLSDLALLSTGGQLSMKVDSRLPKASITQPQTSVLSDVGGSPLLHSTLMRDKSGKQILVKLLQTPQSQNQKIPPRLDAGTSNGLVNNLLPTIVSSKSLATPDVVDAAKNFSSPVAPFQTFNPLPVGGLATKNSFGSVNRLTPNVQPKVITPSPLHLAAKPGNSNSTVISLARKPQSNPGAMSKSVRKCSYIALTTKSSNSNQNSNSTPSSNSTVGSTSLSATSTSCSTGFSSNSATPSTSGVPKASRAKQCEGCHVKPSQFLCAGCSKRSYCSRTCQENDWDLHSDFCV